MCKSRNEHGDIVSKTASSRNLEGKTTKLISDKMQYQSILYTGSKKNINRSPILNKIVVRAPILYKSMNLMVNAIDESADVVVWILEEAVKSDSIDQTNVMEVTLRT